MTRYLDPEEMLVIHAKIIDETGGLHGVRDMNLFASIAGRPKMQFGGKELYPSVFEKAAAYFESTAFHHVFVDGNKRTAIAIAARFLFLNGYDLTTSNKVLERFVLGTVTKKSNLKIIALWFQKHSKKIRK
ncbi:MAG: type II toxin-antitoxin system death-on-curing family toxin [Candidatus Sungbacteria bacterium]|uniref:Type II toxin-antitoxin system death-on-curing family toxin n=1 Tax=Candidatus Sungiibacteriota bacterium TaxID=2750080 RepID=A0A9D6LTY8_9BACT|nr:type II toxin-antitoxin system death-on-curing family toxin [Candidatus Sungbacteria bacterium]